MADDSSKRYEVRGAGGANPSGGLATPTNAVIEARVQFLDSYPIFTDQWFSMCSHLDWLASTAILERNALKKGVSESTTLWERQENVVRIMLERGKPNMCLRNMKDYKVFQQSLVAEEIFKEAVLSKLKQPKESVDASMHQFEQGLGLLLRCTFEAEEALQTIDLNLLLGHIADVITFVLVDPNALAAAASNPNSQECLVVFYLHSIARHLSNIDEDRVMELVQQLDIIRLLILYLQNHASLSKDLLSVAVETLSILVDTEAFGTHPDTFMATPTIKNLLLSYNEEFISGLVSQGLKITPLLDLLDEYKRKYDSS